MAHTFEAKYRGTCADPSCDRPIDVGDAVVYVDQELFHDGCSLNGASPSVLAPIQREVCQACFTEKSVSGECAC